MQTSSLLRRSFFSSCLFRFLALFPPEEHLYNRRRRPFSRGQGLDERTLQFRRLFWSAYCERKAVCFPLISQCLSTVKRGPLLLESLFVKATSGEREGQLQFACLYKG